MDELHQKLVLAAEYGQKLLQQNAALQQEVHDLKADLKRKVNYFQIWIFFCFNDVQISSSKIPLFSPRDFNEKCRTKKNVKFNIYYFDILINYNFKVDFKCFLNFDLIF